MARAAGEAGRVGRREGERRGRAAGAGGGSVVGGKGRDPHTHLGALGLVSAREG